MVGGARVLFITQIAAIVLKVKNKKRDKIGAGPSSGFFRIQDSNPDYLGYPRFFSGPGIFPGS